jgi:protein associated with RNAse G/E
MSVDPYKPFSVVKIKSYKNDGSLHRTWEKNIVLSHTAHEMIIINDRVLVTEANGRTWRTKEPGIGCFRTDYWFNVIALLRPRGVTYYCNLASPFTLDEGTLKYTDFDLDIEVDASGTYRLLDEDEFAENGRAMAYPEPVVSKIKQDVEELKSWIQSKKGPFAEGFVKKWFEQYKRL